MRSHPRRLGLIVGAVAVVVGLAAVSTVAVAAASGALRSHGVAAGAVAPNGQCTVPALSGTVVDVALVNMGGGMMRGGMGGMMRVRADRTQAPGGTISFRVVNTGSLVHEFIVLPLAAGQRPGQRSVGSDGRVDETGSLGEASRSCGEGAGDGIDPGSVGWVTLQLPAGDYELLCNLPGHYAAGMYTQLHVV